MNKTSVPFSCTVIDVAKLWLSGTKPSYPSTNPYKKLTRVFPPETNKCPLKKRGTGRRSFLSFWNDLENKLLLISINFTPKTSHSCLRKWYTMLSRQPLFGGTFLSFRVSQGGKFRGFPSRLVINQSRFTSPESLCSWTLRCLSKICKSLGVPIGIY